MSPTIPPGSVIYVVPTEFERLSENDIITFSTGNSTVTHRIVSIDENNRSLVTKGDGNNLIDANPVPYDKVIGKVMFSNKYLGRIGLYQIRYLLLILAGIIVMKESLRRISSADDLFAQYDDAFNEFMDKLHDGTAGVSGGNTDLIRTFTNFGQMLLGYTCYPIKEWNHFPGNLNGYGIATEQWDINNGEKLLVWWNGQLLMEGVDYMMSAGGYTDPFMHIVTFDRDKYVGGALTLQSWYHPDNIPKDPLEEENNKVAAICGSALTDVSGKKTTTVSGSSGSEINNSGVTTIHGKAVKEGD